MADHRILSLLSSATEMVAALGCHHLLVGRSHECDSPPGVQSLPICSQPRIDIHTSSREIDAQVKAQVEQALSIYEIFPDKLQELQPTVVLTQTLCEVCAVSLKDVEQALCATIGSQPEIVALHPVGLSDLWADLRRIATVLEVPDTAEKVIAELQSRLVQLRDHTARLSHPTVACLEWIDPLMAAGNWVPELVEIAGGINLLGRVNEHSPWMTWAELQAADPEVIVLLPCGYDIPRTRVDLAILEALPEWNSLRAVQTQRVFLTDGNQYFNRPGPRLVDSAEILAEILHPEHFPPTHEGSGWVRA